MSTKRRRLSPEESRIAALEAARAILVEQGAQALTLQTVAARMGRTPGNLLHHFGSAVELQKALGLHIAREVTADITGAFASTLRGEIDPRASVDLGFDAFGKQGGGALAGWMLLTGNGDALDPVLEAIAAICGEVSVYESAPGETARQLLLLSLMAMGNAMMGDALTDTLHLPAGSVRDVALDALTASMAYHRSPEVRASVDRWRAEYFEKPSDRDQD